MWQYAACYLLHNIPTKAELLLEPLSYQTKIILSTILMKKSEIKNQNQCQAVTRTPSHIKLRL